MRVHTVIELAQLITLWALQRKESRWAHYRSDYSEMDPQLRQNFFHIKQWEKLISEWKPTPPPSTRLRKALEQADEENRLKNYTHSE
jgi:succinate dehydrogenase/fumarate reductase flavoprotein subunit